MGSSFPFPGWVSERTAEKTRCRSISLYRWLLRPGPDPLARPSCIALSRLDESDIAVRQGSVSVVAGPKNTPIILDCYNMRPLLRAKMR
ncbi:hypothetical protein C7476_11538 [Phyllobacterium bourgognense]|uniref:Uncharacterized protein n=1 Tax=Phyllobacterium bourgognense TaxID=314236 RepID=A0A368YIL7_9HYPH|nr:hypothetical protein C7476_11538 [Phyllobacterium bourgognense]